MAKAPDTALDDALEALYAAPLDQFIAVRRDRVARFRAAGDKDAAGFLAASPKPSLTAWALNEVARRSPELLAALVNAREVASEAQKRGTAEALRETAREFRARLNDVVQAASKALSGAGHAPSAVQARRMGETLQMAVAEPSETRAQLLAGRLTGDVAQEDPLAGMEVEARSPRAPSTGEVPGSPPRVNEREAERRRLERLTAAKEAEQHVTELEKSLAGLRAQARRAEVAAVRARDEAERARRAVDEQEACLGEERAKLKAAKAAAG